jgi:hypothetical protein
MLRSWDPFIFDLRYPATKQRSLYCFDLARTGSDDETLNEERALVKNMLDLFVVVKRSDDGLATSRAQQYVTVPGSSDP